MKKILLLLTFTALSSTTIVSAQTKTWDFGNDSATWPETGSGVGTIGNNTQAVIDNLGLYSNGPESENQITNFGAVTSNNASFPDGFTATRRFQMNGGGGVTAPVYMPVQRYLFFDVSGSCTVKVWFRPGSNGSQRTIFVTDGTSLIGSGTSNSGENTDFTIVTAAYTGSAARLYVYGDQANNLFKMEVTGATVSTTLGLNDLNALTTNVIAAGSKVFLQNVISSTEVNVYNMTGALVRNFTTSTDLDFELNQGLYIVNVKSDQGEKSVKVIMQ